jgi:hypothetical protein
MKRFILFFIFFLLLTGLHANVNHDFCMFDSIEIPLRPENNQVAQSVCNQTLHKESNTQSSSDVISTLTLVVNSLNNALTSTNNQVTVWSLVLSLITLIIAVIGIIGLVRLNKFDRKFKNIKKHLDYQQKKDELRDLYMERINNWMLEMNLQLADNLVSSQDYYDATNESFKKSYLGYYLTKLSIINVPIEKELSEEKKQAINDIQKSLDQIVEVGGANDLKALQGIAEFEINKEKKKMIKKAAKKLLDRLIKST